MTSIRDSLQDNVAGRLNLYKYVIPQAIENQFIDGSVARELNGQGALMAI